MHQKQARPGQKQVANAARSSGQRARQPAKTRSGRLESVRTAANSYCLRYYGVGYSGGAPQRLILLGADVWIVPAVLTSPGYGVVGPVGVVAVDAGTYEIVGATPPEEVRVAGCRLAEEKQDELKAAFHRARKA